MPSEKDKTPSDLPPGDLRDAAERGDTVYLMEALSAPDYRVREAAALGLGEVGGDRAELALLALARDRWNERPEVRIAALRALVRAQAPSVHARTLAEFITGDNRKVTAAARRMLSAVDPEGFPAILVSRQAVDYGAIRVYGSAAERSAVPLLGRVLLDRDSPGSPASPARWGKLHAAINALGNIGGDESVGILEAAVTYLRELEAGVSGLAAERVKKLLAAADHSLGRMRKG